MARNIGLCMNVREKTFPRHEHIYPAVVLHDDGLNVAPSETHKPVLPRHAVASPTVHIARLDQHGQKQQRYRHSSPAPVPMSRRSGPSLDPKSCILRKLLQDKVKALLTGRVLQPHLEFTDITVGKEEDTFKLLLLWNKSWDLRLCSKETTKMGWRHVLMKVFHMYISSGRAQRAQPGPRGQTEVNPM